MRLSTATGLWVVAQAFGELHRDEVPQHHGPHHPRGARVALRRDPHDLRLAVGQQVRGELDAAPLALRLVGVLEEDGAEQARVGVGPSLELVVARLGHLGEAGRVLCVLVDLGLPAAGHRHREVAAVDDRDRALEPRRNFLRDPPQLYFDSSRKEAVASISSWRRGPTPASAAASEATTNM